MSENLLARPAAGQCGPGGFKFADFAKLWLRCCDHVQELFAQVFHFVQPPCQSLIIRWSALLAFERHYVATQCLAKLRLLFLGEGSFGDRSVSARLRKNYENRLLLAPADESRPSDLRIRMPGLHVKTRVRDCKSYRILCGGHAAELYAR